MVTKYRPGDRESHDRFCVNETWKIVRGAGGQPVKHHRTYELPLLDGRILRTRISKPLDKSTYGKSTWSHILKEQLCIGEPAFWECANNKVSPNRGAPVASVGRLPLALMRTVMAVLGISEREAAIYSKEQAIALINEQWSNAKN